MQPTSAVAAPQSLFRWLVDKVRGYEAKRKPLVTKAKRLDEAYHEVNRLTEALDKTAPLIRVIVQTLPYAVVAATLGNAAML